jgi:hypothetical protein
MDNGLIKKITEQYLIDAMSFTEAEARAYKEAGEGMREVQAVAISRSNIKEVVFYGDTDMWHKCKVCYNLMDEDTEKEKKVTTYLLVNSENVKEAYERCEEHLKEMLVPFTIPQIVESPIIDVYQYEQALRPKAFADKAQDLQNEDKVTKRAQQLIESGGMAIGVRGVLVNPFGIEVPLAFSKAATDSQWGQFLEMKPMKIPDPANGQAVAFEMEERNDDTKEDGEDEEECAMEVADIAEKDPTGLVKYLDSIGVADKFSIYQLNKIVDQAAKLENVTEFRHWLCNEWPHRNGITMDQAGAIYKIFN